MEWLYTVKGQEYAATESNISKKSIRLGMLMFFNVVTYPLKLHIKKFREQLQLI